MAAGTSRWETGSLTTLHWVAVGLAAVTGLVHLALGVSDVGTPMGVSFLLAGLGFVAGIVLFLRGYRRRLLYLLGIPYVGLQIVLYVVFNWPDVVFLADGSVYVVGVVDKIVQALLVAVLVALYRREG